LGIVATSDVLLTWPQQADAKSYAVYGDGGDGSIDYENAVNTALIDDRGGSAGQDGYGLGEYGNTPYGADEAGYGAGAYGQGLYGTDDDGVSCLLERLSDAAHQFAAVGMDAAGNEQTPATAVADLVLAGEPAPPADLAAVAYAAGRVRLTFARSEHDEN